MRSVRHQKALRRHQSLHRPSNLPRILRRFYMAIAVFMGLLVLGSTGFHAIAPTGTSWSDAIFMTLITVTTVGYDEVIALHTVWQRLFAGLMAITGFGTLTFLFTSLTMFFFESDIDDRLRRARMQRAINKLTGHYIVCGFGRVGRNVARELSLTQRSFVAIDEREEPFRQEVDSMQHALFLQGDASDDDMLLMANIEQARGVFAITGDDSRNLMIALSAKQLNADIRVVARCHDVRNIPKMKKAGADAIVSPDFTGGMRIASAMVRPHVVNFLDEMLRSDDGLRVEELVVPGNARSCRIDEFGLRGQHYIIVAVRDHKTSIFNPPADFMLQPLQTLIAMVSPAGRVELLQSLQQLHQNLP